MISKKTTAAVIDVLQAWGTAHGVPWQAIEQLFAALATVPGSASFTDSVAGLAALAHRAHRPQEHL